MKKRKLIVRKPNCIYIYDNAKGVYCDFCGASFEKGFESEWRNDYQSEKSDMQICRNCVKQLFKLMNKSN